MRQTESSWLESGRYLPRFMRDFHDQKDVFKWIGERIDASRKKRITSGEHDYLPDVSWIAAHIYVIDHFLWFMAKHGYTLQRVRKPWPAREWAESIAEMRERHAEAFREMFAGKLEARDAPTGGEVVMP